MLRRRFMLQKKEQEISPILLVNKDSLVGNQIINIADGTPSIYPSNLFSSDKEKLICNGGSFAFEFADQIPEYTIIIDFQAIEANNACLLTYGRTLEWGTLAGFYYYQNALILDSGSGYQDKWQNIEGTLEDDKNRLWIKRNFDTERHELILSIGEKKEDGYRSFVMYFDGLLKRKARVLNNLDAYSLYALGNSEGKNRYLGNYYSVSLYNIYTDAYPDWLRYPM